MLFVELAEVVGG
jgi:hypothetical protein